MSAATKHSRMLERNSLAVPSAGGGRPPNPTPPPPPAGGGGSAADSIAPILAAEGVVRHMEKSPAGGWPTEVFHYSRKYMYLNGEAIEVLRQPAAHTDSDVFAFFRRSDVVVAGDVLDTRQFPVIDVERGGRGAAPPRSARDAAPIDLTGYWVSYVTENWRYRMETPAKGEYRRIPSSPAALPLINNWDPVKDER